MLDAMHPETSDLLVQAIQALWPAFARIRLGKHRVILSSAVTDAFRELQDQAVLICPNHSAHEDSHIIFGLSHLVRQKFYYLTAREIFGGKSTLRARFLRKLGCYSIERGSPDRSAIATTADLLVSGPNRIVIFPEGEISNQNDLLMPLEDGAEHIALSALRELRRAGSTRAISILPLSIKYHYGRNNAGKLTAAIEKIESTLARPCLSPTPISERIKTSFIAMLNKLECDHKPSLTTAASSLDTRLATVRETLISEAQHFLDMKLPENSTQLLRIHLLKNAFTTRKWTGTKSTAKTEPTDKARHCYRGLLLAVDLIAISENTFEAPMTQEKASETINIMADVLFGRPLMNRPDIVTIDTTGAIDVSVYLDTFERNKKLAVHSLKQEIERRLKEKLAELQRAFVQIYV